MPEMILHKTNSVINNIENIKTIIRDPEHFLKNYFYRHGYPNGFRIELFIARKYNLICGKLKQSNLTPLEIIDSWLEKGNLTRMIPVKKLREAVSDHSLTKHSRYTFCPFCEKSVIPKKLHKLDHGDIVLFLLTAGFWAILLFAMYLFIRRCPVCSYNLRGFKFLQKTK